MIRPYPHQLPPIPEFDQARIELKITKAILNVLLFQMIAVSAFCEEANYTVIVPDWYSFNFPPELKLDVDSFYETHRKFRSTPYEIVDRTYVINRSSLTHPLTQQKLIPAVTVKGNDQIYSIFQVQVTFNETVTGSRDLDFDPEELELFEMKAREGVQLEIKDIENVSDFAWGGMESMSLIERNVIHSYYSCRVNRSQITYHKYLFATGGAFIHVMLGYQNDHEEKWKPILLNTLASFKILKEVTDAEKIGMTAKEFDDRLAKIVFGVISLVCGGLFMAFRRLRR